jgi:hypothetical protein
VLQASKVLPSFRRASTLVGGPYLLPVHSMSTHYLASTGRRDRERAEYSRAMAEKFNLTWFRITKVWMQLAMYKESDEAIRGVVRVRSERFKPTPLYEFALGSVLRCFGCLLR